MANYRYLCQKCNSLYTTTTEGAACGCGAVQDMNGYGSITLYRMGSPLGVAVPMDIHFNGTGYGSLVNKECVKIFVPYGNYTVHVAHGMNRKCNDLTFNISESNKEAYVKAALKAGLFTNKIQLTECSASDLEA